MYLSYVTCSKVLPHLYSEHKHDLDSHWAELLRLLFNKKNHYEVSKKTTVDVNNTVRIHLNLLEIKTRQPTEEKLIYLVRTYNMFFKSTIKKKSNVEDFKIKTASAPWNYCQSSLIYTLKVFLLTSLCCKCMGVFIIETPSPPPPTYLLIIFIIIHPSMRNAVIPWKELPSRKPKNSPTDQGMCCNWQSRT